MCIQVIIASVGGIYVFSNYASLTKADSISENYTLSPSTKPHIAPATVNKTDTTLSYKGIFGEVVQGKVDSTDGVNYETKSLERVAINRDTVQHYYELKSLYDTKQIDAYMFSYLLTSTGDVYTQRLQDLTFLAKYRKGNLSSMDTSSAITQVTALQAFAAHKALPDLVTALQAIQNEYSKDMSNTTQLMATDLVNNQAFSYVRKKLVVDEAGLYSGAISDAAKSFGIAPAVIRSAIMTEQLRGLLTYRGQLKDILASDKYLMVMTQSSYGIGGMKLATAQKLETRLAASNPSLYTQYLAYATGDATSIASTRFWRLTNTQDYRRQIYYTTALLYQYSSERSAAGYPITDKPGILTTLYNIGDRTPVPSPTIGGSSLNIQGQSYSFGGLGMYLTYFQEMYYNK